MKKLDEEVIDIGREFQTLDCKLLKICATKMRSIVVGCSGTIIITWILVRNIFRNIGGNN